MSFAQGVTVVRALCVFYYGKSVLCEKVRNRMRNVAVNRENAITGKGKKMHFFRNRMRDEAVKKIVLLREKVENA